MESFLAFLPFSCKTCVLILHDISKVMQRNPRYITTRAQSGRIGRLCFALTLLPTFLFTFALTSCRKDAAHDDEHHHHALTVTAYSERTELFAEVEPLFVGHRSVVRCHLTRLADFKPLAGVNLSLILTEGKRSEVSTAEATETDGLYLIYITPAREGIDKLTFVVRDSLGTDSLVVTPLRISANETLADAYAESRAIEHPNAVAFSKEQSWLADFMTTPVSAGSVGQVIHATAQVMPNTADETVVAAKTDGIVTLHATSLVEGMAVSGGQSLCSIQSVGGPDDNLGIQYAQAQAELQRARTEYDRLQKLADDKLVTASELTEAKAALDKASIVCQSMRGQQAGGTEHIAIPRSGFLKQINVRSGQFVSRGDVLAVVTQSQTLRLRADVPASSYALLSGISGGTLRLCQPDGGTRVVDFSEVGGRLSSFSRQTSAQSPLIAVYFDINNVVDLVPGSFVDVTLRAGSSSEISSTQVASNSAAVSVPSAAVMEEMGTYFVYVQLTPELFEKRQVRLGTSDGILTTVTSGLSVGDRVVSRGAIMLKLQQSAGAVDPHSGHSH